MRLCKSVIMVFCKNMKKVMYFYITFLYWHEMGDSYSVSPVEGSAMVKEEFVYTQVLLAILHQM